MDTKGGAEGGTPPQAEFWGGANQSRGGAKCARKPKKYINFNYFLKKTIISIQLYQF